MKNFKRNLIIKAVTGIIAVVANYTCFSSRGKDKF